MTTRKKIKLNMFDMSKVRDDNVILMLGKRNTGKSFLTRDLLSYHSDIPAALVISPTEVSNSFYSKMIPPLFIHDEYHPDIISNVVSRQKKMVHRSKTDPSIDPRCMLIMDDCLYDSSKWQRDTNLRFVFLNGRHIRIMFILTSQYALGLPPTMRNNIDYVFILRENLIKSRRLIYENYCGMLENFETFCAVLDQTTEDFECLVVCNNTRSNKIEDQIFYYKAGNPPEFRIGSKTFWDMNNARLDEESSEDDEPADSSRSRKVIVKKV